jgi:hypothetical protein
MADQTSTFAIELEDETSDPADSAADALERLRTKIEADTAALSGMQRAMRNLKGGTSTNVAAFKSLRDQITAQKEKVAQAQSKFVNLGGAFKKTEAAGESLTDAAQTMGGSVGSLAGRFQAMTRFAGGAHTATLVMAAGCLAAVAAFAALGVAVVAAAAALFKYGLAAADARRSEGLMLEGMTRTINWYGRAHDKAGDLQKAIDGVAGSSALGRGQIVGMAQSLYGAQMRGENLRLALEGLATVQAAAGDGQAAMYRNMLLGGARTQGGIKRISDDIKARFGGVARAQMASLTVQSAKLRESFDMLFSGLALDGFLEGLKSITDLFSQSTATGRQLKVIVEALFKPMLAGLEKVFPIAKRFFQGMVIGALIATIGVQRLAKWLKKTFGDSEILKGFNAQKTALYAGVAIFGGLATAVLAVAAAFAVVAAVVAAPIVLLAVFIKRSVAAYEAFKRIQWGEAAKAMIDGLVNGIKNGGQWVVDAIKNLGAKAMKALKEKLGIASPSKVFARLGIELPKGAAVGVRSGTRVLEAEIGRMGRRGSEALELGGGPVAQPTPRAAALVGRQPASSLPPINLTVNVNGAGETDPARLARMVREAVAETIEGLATRFGARLEPA